MQGSPIDKLDPSSMSREDFLDLAQALLSANGFGDDLETIISPALAIADRMRDGVISRDEFVPVFRASTARHVRIVAMLALFAAASAAIELTPDNFDQEVFQSGKAAFVKFLAPW